MGNTVGDRIEKLRLAKGFSRRDLSLRAGLGETYVRDLVEKPNREPVDSKLRAVCAALGADYEYVRWGFSRTATIQVEAGVSEGAAHYRAIIPDLAPSQSRASGAKRRNVANAEIPEREVISRAGPENHISDEAITGSWVIPARSVRDFRLQTGHASIIQVRGDSMAPTLLDGDRVLVDESDSHVAGNGIFAIFAGEGVIVKRLEPILNAPGEPRKLRIRSDNPAYAPQEIEEDWVRVIGRVRGLIRPL